MQLLKFTETESYIKGDNAQKYVESILQSQGWYSLPSYGYAEDANKAPKLLCPGRRPLVLPDLDVSQSRKRRWIEVKFKSTNSIDPKTGMITHGIHQDHYFDYLDIEEATGNPVFLVIWQGDTNEILCRSLKALSNYQDFFDKKCKAYKNKKMVFFPKEKFRVWNRTEDFGSKLSQMILKG